MADQNVKLSKDASGCLMHVLRNTNVKGRSESRCHAKITREIKAKCFKMLDEEREAGNFTEGELVLNEDTFKFLKDLVNKAESGTPQIPGSMSVGWVDLFEAVDAVK